MDRQTRRILYVLSAAEREWFHTHGAAHLLAHVPPVAYRWHQRPTLADGVKESKRLRRPRRSGPARPKGRSERRDGPGV